MGLILNIEDVMRRVGVEGLVAIGPDLISPLGDTPSDADSARDLLNKFNPPQTTKNLAAAVF